MPHTYSQGDEPVPGSGYRLSSFLGRGGFGEVWKATAPGGAEAALKIIRLGGQEGRKEFRALQLVKRIRHPNLVPIIAFWLKGADGGILDDALAGQEQLAMGETVAAPLRATMVAPPEATRPQAAELIVAMGLGDLSLFDRLEQCRAEGLDGIPQDELLRYMEDVAEAIDFLNRPVHDLGSGPAAIQHCDIKPHNLMIVGGAAQICDFGLARMMGADRMTTAAATVAYAAPECLQTGQPSSATDQYSLAVSYYELRTGLLPYQDETLAAVMNAKQQGDLDFSRLNAAEQAALRRATKREPAERFPSAAAMVKELRIAASGADVAGPRERRRVARRGPRVLTPLVLLALLAGAAWGGWFLWSNYGDRLLAGREERGPTILPPPHPLAELTTTVPPPTKIETPAAPPTLERAEELAAHGDRDGAIAIYAALIASESTPADVKASAYFGRGRCLLSIPRYGQAIDDFEQAVHFDPHDAQGFARRKELVAAYLARGKKHFADKDYQRAIPDLQRVRELTPKDAEAASLLGHAWFAQNEFQKARDEFTAALEIRLSGDDLTARGQVYQKLSRPKEAMADFAKAVQLDDGSAAAHFFRGTAFLAEKDYAAALADFEKAMALDPRGERGYQTRKEYADAYLELGFAALKKGEYDEAIANFDRASHHDPNNALIFSRRAGAWFRKGKLDKAIEDYGTAIKLQNDPADYVYRGKVYEKMGDLDKALADFSSAIAANANADAYASRGLAYMTKYDKSEAQADLDHAVDDLTHAVDLGRKSSDANFPLELALYFRASCYVLAKQYELAARDCDDIIRRDTKSIGNLHERLDELAAGFADERKWSAAAEWETKAIGLAPDADTKAEYGSRLKQYQAGKP